MNLVNNNKKGSEQEFFRFYRGYAEASRQMKPKPRGELLCAVIDYMFYGEEPSFKSGSTAAAVWVLLKKNLDKSIQYAQNGRGKSLKGSELLKGPELYLANQAALDYEDKLWEISLESYEDIRKPERSRIRQLIQQGKKPGEDVATDLREMDYQQFLNTGYWKILSAHIKAKNDHSCQLCGAKTNLEVHHITYEHRGCESAYQDDLVCLCHNCHAKEHEKETCYEE